VEEHFGDPSTVHAGYVVDDELIEFVLCYALVLPGRKSGFRTGFRPDFGRSLVGTDFEAFPIRIRPKSGPEARSPARKHFRVP
jgi:hypothetical protein